jgi:hypothetical protein
MNKIKVIITEENIYFSWDYCLVEQDKKCKFSYNSCLCKNYFNDKCLISNYRLRSSTEFKLLKDILKDKNIALLNIRHKNVNIHEICKHKLNDNFNIEYE